jgi:hypothetical protein
MRKWGKKHDYKRHKHNNNKKTYQNVTLIVGYLASGGLGVDRMGEGRAQQGEDLLLV